MPIPLNEYARSLVDARTFATVATINADGSPQTSVVWVRRDGDRILFSTTTGRLKGRNLARDPRVSVTLFPLDDPYHTVEVRAPPSWLPIRTGRFPAS
jgi:PPOX class probable F420-dependent enzyme